MSLPSDLSAEVSARRSEKRFFTVVKVDLEARFMMPSGAESRCRVVEMSTAGMTFKSPAHPKRGEKIIVYIAELGRFEGQVEQTDFDQFAIGLKLTELKHKKLAEQLVWFANREILDLGESRKHRRIVPMMQRTIVKSSNGKERMGKVNDVSLTSVNVEATGVFVVGAQVKIGQKAATVTRIFDGGFVADFAEPFAEEELNETTRI